jgi:hypothetical protein
VEGKPLVILNFVELILVMDADEAILAVLDVPNDIEVGSVAISEGKVI